MDREGKDTWRHRKAGAQTIAISSPSRVAAICEIEGEMSLEELAGRFFWREDILLTEGYKRSRFPKIEVFRSAIESKPICGPEDNLLAIVTDDEVSSEVVSFGFADVNKVADFIEERFLEGRKKHQILVQLDGKRLPMNDFVRDIVVAGIRGMLSSLRGWKDPKKIDIQIRLEEN